MQRDNDTFIVQLTVGELIEILKERFPALAEASKSAENSQPFEGPSYSGRLVYGIRGIEKLFGISHRTAQAWKNTWLAPAVRQNGRKIVTDVEYAFKLFDKCEKKR